MAYDVGDQVTVSATFRVAGAETDPTSVTLYVTDPSGNVATVLQAALANPSVGVWTYAIPIDEAGRWHYRFVGTGSAAGVESGSFSVGSSTRYASVEAWKLWALDEPAYAENAAGTSLDGVIAQRLDAASRDIDGDCGRVFYVTEDEAVLSRVDVDGLIRFVDVIAGSITEVLFDLDGDGVPEHELQATDYLPWPVHENGRAPRRYQRMRRNPGGAIWPAVGALVQITANRGYIEDDGDPPADIVEACMLRAGRLFARREAKLGAIAVPSLGTVGMVRGQDGDYWDLISAYIHPDSAGAVLGIS